MRIRMISTQRGADDGITLRTYEAGQEYDVGGTPRADDLATVFLREGWAVEALEEKKPEPELDSRALEVHENRGRRRGR